MVEGSRVTESEFNQIKNGAILVGQYLPLYNGAKMKNIAAKGITLFSMDMLPRTTRGQAMDVLSSQANIAGYRAVLEAAVRFPRFFPMMMTSAGSSKPARVAVLGVGVAGLQAIKCLGEVAAEHWPADVNCFEEQLTDERLR